MLKPTVRNLYQFMSVQAELHNPDTARRYYLRGNVFLLVKTKSNIFRVDQDPINSCTLKIIKNRVVQTYANIPQFGKTRVYKSGVRVTD